MFNIADNKIIVGLKKTGCSKGHIAQCISDKNLHENPKYTYVGKRVQRGAMVLHTKNGDFTLMFDVENGWAREVVIL